MKQKEWKNSNTYVLEVMESGTIKCLLFKNQKEVWVWATRTNAVVYTGYWKRMEVSMAK